MDTAIKAEWYDLDDADRAGFLAWLHGYHLPALQARPGHIWIGHYNRAPQTGTSNPPGYPARVETDDPNVPRGSQYLLVTAAASPDVFFDPNATTETDAETKALLAKRKEYRFCIFLEETRVSGPDWYRHLPGTGAPPAIQLGNYQTRDQTDDWTRLMVPADERPRTLAPVHRRTQAGFDRRLGEARHPLRVHGDGTGRGKFRAALSRRRTERKMDRPPRAQDRCPCTPRPACRPPHLAAGLG